MAKKKKCKCEENQLTQLFSGSENYQPLYVQSTHPSPELFAWMEKMLEKTIIYFQSGKPGNNCGGPGQPPCH